MNRHIMIKESFTKEWLIDTDTGEILLERKGVISAVDAFEILGINFDYELDLTPESEQGALCALF